jgi:hypothetical protein
MMRMALTEGRGIVIGAVIALIGTLTTIRFAPDHLKVILVNPSDDTRIATLTRERDEARSELAKLTAEAQSLKQQLQSAQARVRALEANGDAGPRATPTSFAGGPTGTVPPGPALDRKLIPWNRDARFERHRLWQEFPFRCPPSGEINPIYGTDIYSYGSSICSAAVHVGLFDAVTGGDMTIRILGPRSGFEPSTRHGVSSSPWNGKLEAYEFVHR